MMKNFFARHPVFNLEEFACFYSEEKNPGARTVNTILAYYLKTGRITGIRRGLYAVVPDGENAEQYTPDPFLLASRICKDAVLVYHTALEFHGRAYSSFNRFTYQTNVDIRSFSFRNWQFKPVAVPAVLLGSPTPDIGILSVEYKGLDIRVASLERTLVDVLNRPVYSGSWEEIWRSLGSIEFFDLDLILKYVKVLNNATTAGAVGFFLEQHRDSLLVEEKYLDALKTLCPKQPHFLDSRKRKGKLQNPWNLIVPTEILNKTWNEIL